MQSKDCIKQWIRDTLLNLPVSRERFFKNIWKKDKIAFTKANWLTDRIDEINSQLLCTAFSTCIPLLIIMPDSRDYRGAIAFSVLIVKLSIDGQLYKMPRGKILYIGKNSRFKYFLQSIYLDNIPIKDAFSLVDNKKSKGNVNLNLNVPQIQCIYDFDNPLDRIIRFNPSIVAIDFSNETNTSWLAPVMQYCQMEQIVILGWTNNNFTSLPSIFESNNGSVIYHYPRNENSSKVVTIKDVFLDDQSYGFKPVLLKGPLINKLDMLFVECKKALNNYNFGKDGRVKNDAARITWNYIKSLETLCIPIEIYNAEADSYWNVFSFDKVRRSIGRFIEIIEKYDDDFTRQIQKVIKLTDEIVELFRNNEPPYWSFLIELCLQKRDGQSRIIIFPKQSQKELFQYTLLSRCNITVDELKEHSNTFLFTWKELNNVSMASNNIEGSIRLYVIGLPDVFKKNYLLQFCNFNPRIAILPHQLASLKRLVDNFNSLEKDHPRKNIKTIKRLSGISDDIQIPTSRKRFSIDDDWEVINVAAIERPELTVEDKPLVDIGTLDYELANLLEREEIEEIETLLSNYTPIGIKNDQLPFIEGAIKLSLERNYQIILDKNDQVNILKAGEVTRVFVRSVETGMKIVIVDNKARNDLFDLIISRVHNHPSLEIHIAVLKKWKEELAINYMMWKENLVNTSNATLLALLQSRGSIISNPLTVSNWLNGITLRPQDDEDIRRIGEILNSKFIINNYKRIAKAASRIVGIHIQLSKSLNGWLTNKLDIGRNDMEIVDGEMELTFGEIRDSIKILKVLNKSTLEYPISSDFLSVLTID